MDEPSGEEVMDEDAELDPRIQDELEKLNKSSGQINELENQLDTIRNAFRQLFASSTAQMESLAKELGPCVEKARPYYTAMSELKEAHANLLRASNRYDKACARLSAAKEMTHKAEMNACSGGPITETIQETLNHAISRVNEAEKEKLETLREHQAMMALYVKAESKKKNAESGHKRDIKKARRYFMMVHRCNATMKEEKTRVQIYEEKVQICKSLYAEALHNLEAISEDIHRRRRELGQRGRGVGAELATPVEETAVPAGGDAVEKSSGAEAERPNTLPAKFRMEAEAEAKESRRERRISAGRASTLPTGASLESAEEGAGRVRGSHRRTRHRTRQLRISATPLVGFLTETANQHAREVARIQERASRHQLPLDAWSPAESAESDWAEGASLDGEASAAWGVPAGHAAALRSEEEAFAAWKQQTARLHDAMQPYDGDDEDNDDEAACAEASSPRL